MIYKMIALDVDGTLLNDDHKLTDQTKYAVRRADEAGIYIVLCTGRGPMNAIPIMEELGLEGVMITHNGAVTIYSEDSRVVDLCSFNKKEIAPFLQYCRQHRVQFDLCAPSQLYGEYVTDAGSAMYLKFGVQTLQVENVLDLEVSMVKLSVFADSSHMDQMEVVFRQMDSPLSIIRSGDHFMDIMHPEATKGNALKRLAEELGIERSQIMAIGNYFNDLEMIEYAGLGIAMENSPDSLKKLADTTTASNNDDGVHKAIMLHCFGEQHCIRSED